MKALQSMLRVLCLFCLLCGPVLAQPSNSGPNYGRIGQWVAEGRFAEAAEELQEISLRSGASLKRLGPAAEKTLGQMVRRARGLLKEKHPLQERNAARQVLCQSRAYFSEELPGADVALRVVGGGDLHRPELIGQQVTAPLPPQARKTGIRGTVIVEVMVDPEGCVRLSRVLKGVPMGVDTAALATVRSWTFQPALLKGRPVAVYYTLLVSYPPRRE
jgi:TonB family protein